MDARRAVWLTLGVVGLLVAALVAATRPALPSWLGGPDRYGAASAVRDDGPHRLRLVGLYGGRGCSAHYDVSAGRSRDSRLVVTVAAHDGATEASCSASLFGASASVTYSGPHPSLVEFAHTPDSRPVLGEEGIPHLLDPRWQVTGESRSQQGLWRRCFTARHDQQVHEVCLTELESTATWRDQPGEERLTVAGRPVRLVMRGRNAFALVGEGSGALQLAAYDETRADVLDLIAQIRG